MIMPDPAGRNAALGPADGLGHVDEVGGEVGRRGRSSGRPPRSAPPGCGRADRGDREERDAAVVPPDEPARQLAVDDPGEDASAWPGSYGCVAGRQRGRTLRLERPAGPADVPDRARTASSRPERHHAGPAGLPAGVPLAAVRAGQPGGGRLAARRPRRHRLGRRLHRPPLPPGLRPRQGPRPGRRPAAVLRRRRRHHHRRLACPLWFGDRRARPRGARGRRHARAGRAGRPAHRRHLVRQGRHVRPDVRLPAVPGRRTRTLSAGPTPPRCWPGSPASPAWSSATTRAVRTSRSARRAWRRRRRDRRASARARRGRRRVSGSVEPMKAVIMAGGEGTRLRPLTSNAPKPMLPAGQPADDGAHRRRCCSRHGFDEIVVTVAFLANAHPHLLRRRLRVRRADGLRHRGDAARHRRLGAQRHGRARRALPRHLRRRAHRHRPRRDRRLPRGARGAGHHRARRRSRTRSSSASSSPTRTAPSSASSRSRPGARCSATPSTPASSCSSPRSSTTSPPDRPVDFSSEVFPTLLDDGQAAVRRGRRGLLGGRRHARGLRAGPQGRPRRQGRRSTSPASSWPTACGWGRAPRSTPTPASRARRSSATTAGSRPAPASASTRCSAPTSGCAATPTSSASSSTTTPTSARACACGARSSAGPATCARGVRCEEGVGARRRVLRRRGRRHRRGRQGLPVQDGRGRRRRSTRSIVWESRGARSLFGRDGVAGLANVDITPELAAKVAMAYGHHAEEGLDGHHVARLEPVGPHAQAGDDGRAQRRRASTSSTSRWPRCRSPGSSSASPRRPGGITVRLWPATRSRSSSGSSTPTALDITEDAQRKIERLFYREDFRRVFAGRDRRHRLPAPGPRALHRRARGHGRRRARSPTAGFKVVVDYGYGSTSFVMPNVLAKLGADVLAVNPYASTAGHDRLRPRRRTPRGVAALVRASGAHLGAVHRPRRRAPHPHRRRRATSSTDTEALLALRRRWCRDHLLGDRVALPVDVSRRGRASSPSRHGVAGRAGRRLSTPALMDAATEAGVGFAASLDGGFILPVPARLRRRRLAGQAARAAGPSTDAALSEVVDDAAPRCTSPTRRWSPRGSRRASSCGPGRAEQGPRARARRRGEGAPRRRAGCSRCPTPRSRSPTSGPRARPTPRPGAWPRSTPAASARCCAERPRRRPQAAVDPLGRRCGSGSVRAHERPRRPAVLDRPRVGPARGRHGARSASPTTPRTRSATSCSSQLPEVGATVDARRERSARSSRPSRCPTSTPRSPARSSRSTPTWPTRPSGSTRTPTARAGSASSSSADAAAARRRCSTPTGYRALDRGLTEARPMADVFCNQLRAPQPAGVELLLVVRRAARARAPRTTDHDHVPARRRRRGDRRRGQRRPRRRARRRRACWSSTRGPNAGSRVRPRRRRRRPPAATPTATSSSTTSPCRAATPRSPRSGGGYVVRDVGSLNGTYLNRERIERGAARPTATSCRSASSSWCSSPAPGRAA